MGRSSLKKFILQLGNGIGLDHRFSTPAEFFVNANNTGQYHKISDPADTE